MYSILFTRGIFLFCFRNRNGSQRRRLCKSNCWTLMVKAKICIHVNSWCTDYYWGSVYFLIDRFRTDYLQPPVRMLFSFHSYVIITIIFQVYGSYGIESFKFKFYGNLLNFTFNFAWMCYWCVFMVVRLNERSFEKLSVVWGRGAPLKTYPFAW